MRFKVDLGEFAPDLPQNGHGGLVTANNCIPTPNGYRPLRAFSSIVEEVLTGFRGGAAFVGSDGTASLLSGTATDLELYSGTWASVEGSLTVMGRWRFTQFADTVVCVYGGAPVEFDLVGQTAGTLAGTPPEADLCATVREFVVLAGDPAAQQTVSWSDQGLPDNWTTGQAGSQPLFTGGEITGLAGGEYGLIFQRNAIRRMTYTADPDNPFQFDVIATNTGCIAKGSLVQAGNLVFCLSERGFIMCDGNGVTPIGAEKIDRTFFATYPRSELENIYAAVDPRNYLVMWSMPGNPGKLWIYNWQLQRWATGETSLIGVFSGFTANIGLDSIDALYPGGVDSIPVSLDSSLFQGGDPLLIAVDQTGDFGVFSGDPMEQTYRIPFVEPIQGRYARIWNSRPISNATTGVTVSIDARARLGDASASTSQGTMQASGDVPIRASGRFLDIGLTINDPLCTYAQAIELDLGAGGAR